MEKIRKFPDKSACNELFYRHLRKPLNIHRVSRNKMRKVLNLLRKACRIRAYKGFHPVLSLYPRICTAYGAVFRNFNIIRSCKILGNLRDNHVCFVYRYRIADSECKLAHDTDIMNRSAAHGRAFKLHRLKNRNRVDKSRPRSAPLDFSECAFFDFVLPFKSNRVARKLRSFSKRSSVFYVIIAQNKTVRRHRIVRNLCLKGTDRIRNRLCIHADMLHNLKASFRQPVKLLVSCLKFHSVRRHK